MKRSRGDGIYLDWVWMEDVIWCGGKGEARCVKKFTTRVLDSLLKAMDVEV